MNWIAYYQLARFHKPIGILLLWYPTAWALWIANQGKPSWHLVLLFSLGIVLMRAAGCIINDIADRHIDLHVERTALRPLTCGKISLSSAISLVVVLVLASLYILLQLPTICFIYGLIAFYIAMLYPFCKRFIRCPQLILGIAFSLGMPMAYAASGHAADRLLFCLFLINFAWIVAYDTQYAMVDRADDERIGVNSTAIFFSAYGRAIIAFLQGFVHALWFVMAVYQSWSFAFYLCWFLAGTVFIYQQQLLKKDEKSCCFKAFASNSWYGFCLWLGVVLA